MRWMDLSLPIEKGMPVYPGDPPVCIEPVFNHEEHAFQVSRLIMGSHTGTHLDAPRHYLRDGASVDQLPLEQLIVPALVVRCPWQPGQYLDAARLDLSRLRPGDALLLATGWDEKAGTAAYFEDIPLFSPGSKTFLKSLGISLLGVDLPTVCEAAEPPQPAAMHLELLDHGVVIVENLVNLMPLAGKRVEFMALPLRLAGGDGSPVRACAREIEETAD